MEIHIDKLKTTVLQLNHCIEEYEEIYMNFYHVVSSSSFFWNDERSKKFFDNMYIEKNHVKRSIDELHTVKEIYGEIISNYEQIGNRMKVQLKEKNNVVSHFNQYLDQIQLCISICKKIPLATYPEVSSLISREHAQLMKIYEETEDLKDRLVQLFDRMQEFEDQINKKVSQLQIQKMTDIREGV